MEQQLKDLLAIGGGPDYYGPAASWKQDGKKVVGVLCSYVPEEIIHAAGMLPVRIIGTRNAGTPRADLHRPPHTCVYCTHVLESLYEGEYDFLDAMVATSWDQDLVRLWDVWTYLAKTPSTYIMHLPLSDSKTHVRQFEKEVRKFFNYIQELAGRPISPEDLAHSIALYNRLRELLHQVYALRKRAVPPLTGADTLRLTLAAMLLPVEETIERLEPLMPYLETRQADIDPDGPRLMVSSDRLDDYRFLELVEECGCTVAMDDLDTGSRWFWNITNMINAKDLDRMIEALAICRHTQPSSPSMMNWAEQVENVAAWVKEYNLDGVLELPLMYSRSRQMRVPYFRKKLSNLGVRTAAFERDYQLANEGQLRTRVGAFVEMLN